VILSVVHSLLIDSIVSEEWREINQLLFVFSGDFLRISVAPRLKMEVDLNLWDLSAAAFKGRIICLYCGQVLIGAAEYVIMNSFV
jgi:hypothetical protein